MTWLISKALMRDFENSHCLQGQAAESLADTCSDGGQSAQSSSESTPQAYCASDKMTAFSRLSRFGITFAPLKESHGEALLTWYLADSRARTSASQAQALGWMVSGQDSGQKWRGSLAKYDPATHSLKTAQCSLFEDSTECCVTLPRSGTMRNGVVYQRKPVEVFTSGTESGLSVPTPGKNEGRGSSKNRYINSPEYRGAKTSEGLRTCETDPIYLNPSFGELIMMWPQEWTGLLELEMDKFLEWQQQHLIFWQDD